MSEMHLRKDFSQEEPIRAGFGRGLLDAGHRWDNVVGVCADLTESTKMNLFAEAFPDWFIQAGVAEQNLVTVGSGLAAMGKIPFVSSYAAFSPGRNWEQIRTTICLNDVPVKIVGSHAGVSVGQDGATHQMLEDVAIMRALPNMVVIAPCDSIEAQKATIAMALDKRPNYIRLAREKTPIITSELIGGLGGAVAELLGEQLPTKLVRIGMKDRFGESGKPDELLKHFGLTGFHIAAAAHHMLLDHTNHKH
jgi:transketolase C-terminal domain/subunit